MKTLYNLIFALILISPFNNLIAQSSTDCQPVALETLLGDFWHSALPAAGDIDGDGKTELLSSNQAYWYIMKYDSLNNEYSINWISEVKSVNNYGLIRLIDINQDSNDEILIVNGDKIEIYNPLTLNLDMELSVPDVENDRVYDINLADGDNDGQIELLVSYFTKTYLFSITSWTQKRELNFGGLDLKCGNVDNDSYNELVYSNKIYLVPGDSEPIVKAVLSTVSPGYEVKLQDIDNDEMLEVITVIEALEVYDADIMQVKYSIPVIYCTSSFIYDINMDGSQEIVLADKYNHQFKIFNVLTGDSIGFFPYFTEDVNKMTVIESDNDEDPEVLITRQNSFLLADLQSFNTEWESSLNSGPVTAVKTGDVDSDGNTEIVTLTYRNIISVIDASTNEVEWQSASSLIPVYLNLGSMDLELADIDNDDTTEIVVSTAKEIVIINGITHGIESIDSIDYYGEDIIIHDLFNDGTKELIITKGNGVYVINPSNFEVLQQYGINVSSFLDKHFEIITGNIDGDSNTEIIAQSGYISIIDPVTMNKSVSPANIYNCIDTYDIDHDGISEIYAGTRDGRVEIIRPDFVITELTINLPASIDAIKLIKFLGDEDPILVLSSGGKIHFYSYGGFHLADPIELAGLDYPILSSFDPLVYLSKEFIIGTKYQVIKLGLNCFECYDFKGNLTTNPSHCNNNGSASVLVTGGLPPYSYLWSNGSVDSSIDSLSAGDYSVNITDYNNCNLNYSGHVGLLPISLHVQSSWPDYAGTDQCEGKLILIPSGVTPPYSYTIVGEGTISGDTISGLCHGYHLITITDSFGCTTEKYANIEYLVGMDEKADIKNMYILPNPASDVMTIKNISFKTGLNYVIISGTGTQVLQGVITQSNPWINVCNLSPGVYFIRLFDADTVAKGKFIIQ